MISDLVTPRHLCRKAVIYIRQSTPHQVLTNQESLRLQYALRQRARELGWPEADIDGTQADPRPWRRPRTPPPRRRAGGRPAGPGWPAADFDVIDADLGLSGAAATHRQGFKELVARVTL